MDQNYIFLTTFYDIDHFRQAAALLKREGVPFKITDNSNLPNYRVPMSTFTKIDLFVLEQDIQTAETILRILLKEE